MQYKIPENKYRLLEVLCKCMQAFIIKRNYMWHCTLHCINCTASIALQQLPSNNCIATIAPHNVLNNFSTNKFNITCQTPTLQDLQI